MVYKDYPLFVGLNEGADLPSKYQTKDDMKNTRSFRIPSLLTAPNGNVIAAIDRASTGADWGKIDIAVRISKDSGETWSEMKMITNMPTRVPPQSVDDTASAFAIDPVMTVTKNGEILMMFDMWPESKGLHDRSRLESGSGYVEIDGQKYLALFDSKSSMRRLKSKTRATGYNCYTVRENGFIYDPDGVKTLMYLPQRHACYEDGYATMGDLYLAVGEPDYIDKAPPLIPKEPQGDEDVYLGNIYLTVATPPLKDKFYFVQKTVADKNCDPPFKSDYPAIITKPAPLRVAVTSHLWCMRSADGGETWSAPYNINAMVKRPEDKGFFGVAPGNAITLQYQENPELNGRILVPAYNLKAAAVIYSDDDGYTWTRNDKGYIKTSGENQLFEYSDGCIQSVSRPLFVSAPKTVISTDGGRTWKKGKPLEIACVHCQKAIITLPVVDGKQYVLCSHSTGHFGKDSTRTCGVISLGLADTKTHTVKWTNEMSIKQNAYYKDFEKHADFFAYSAIAQLPDGTIGVLYEAYPSGYIVFTKFDILDLTLANKPALPKKIF